VNSEALRSSAPRLSELELSDNLLCRWDSVVALARGAPNLKMLSLSGNRFSFPEEPLEACVFPNLETLVLNETFFSVSDLLRMRPQETFPNLQELFFCRNGLVDLSTGTEDDAATLASAFPNLKALHLSENLIVDWEQVWKLSKLPSLQGLFLGGNRLTSIAFGSEAKPLQARDEPDRAFALRAALEASGGGSDSPPPFGSLSTLTISDNPLASWTSIDELAHFPSLAVLRATGAGVVAEVSPSKARTEILARVGTIVTLNGSEARPREKEDAEKAFVRSITAAILSSTAAPSLVDALGLSTETLDTLYDAFLSASLPEKALEILRAHPRFFPLLFRHGDASSVLAASAPKEMAVTSVTVTLRSMAGSSCMMDPVSKRLPLSTTVHTVKQLAARTFKADLVMCRLSFRETKVCARWCAWSASPIGSAAGCVPHAAGRRLSPPVPLWCD
jgi:hypothetical protein